MPPIPGRKSRTIDPCASAARPFAPGPPKAPLIPLKNSETRFPQVNRADWGALALGADPFFDDPADGVGKGGNQGAADGLAVQRFQRRMPGGPLA